MRSLHLWVMCPSFVTSPCHCRMFILDFADGAMTALDAVCAWDLLALQTILARDPDEAKVGTNLLEHALLCQQE